MLQELNKIMYSDYSTGACNHGHYMDGCCDNIYRRHLSSINPFSSIFNNQIEYPAKPDSGSSNFSVVLQSVDRKTISP